MYIYTCTYKYMDTAAHLGTGTRLNQNSHNMHACMCVCMYIYIYTYIYIHTYTYTATAARLGTGKRLISFIKDEEALRKRVADCRQLQDTLAEQVREGKTQFDEISLRVTEELEVRGMRVCMHVCM